MAQFSELLQSGQPLPERAVIQPFFKQRKQLSAFLGSYVPDAFPADRIAFEYSVFGDFAVDIVVGNSGTSTFCVIELEDGTPESVLASKSGRSTKEWGRRFEHGFSQIVDWFYALDDMKETRRFERDFGHKYCRFHGMLLIGRGGGLSEDDVARIRWRSEKVPVNSHRIDCLTFDDVHEQLSSRLIWYSDPASRS
jgi:Domain of unknown function (DUF4263)